MVRDIVSEHKHNTGKLSHFPFQYSLSLFTDAAWTEHDGCCGTGSVLVNGNQMVLFAGASNTTVESSTQVEIIALEEALNRYIERSLYHTHIYSDCTSLVDMLYKEDLTVSWRFSDHLKRV